MHQVVSDWQNWCRNLSDVNICFQRGSNDCSAESRNGMTSIKDADYLRCLPAYRHNVQKYGTYLQGLT